MATKTTIPTADCKVVDHVKPEPKVIKLCQFMLDQGPSTQFARTSKYAEDPRGYLVSTIGEEAIKARGDLLCIPKKTETDMYGSSPTKLGFETHIAKLLAKEHGLFFQTGIQAQLAAMKIHCTRANNNRVAWHVTCHLETAEEEAYKELYGLEHVLIGSSPDELPTVDEVKALLALPPNERPAVILVEIPNRSLGCETYTYEGLQDLSSACKDANVVLHCDGARLWEIEPWYAATSGKSFRDIGALFDTLYVSFYKGLGGVTGAMLVSDDIDFINEAKMWQRRAGGNAFSMAYEVIDDQRGYNEVIGTLAQNREKMITVAEQILERTKKFKDENGEAVVSFRPSPPTCCQTHTIFRGFTGEELEAARDRVQEATNVRVFERLRPKQTVDEMQKKERAAASRPTTSKFETAEDESELSNGTATEQGVEDKLHYMEWSINSVTEHIETHVFIDGYESLCEELVAGKRKK